MKMLLIEYEEEYFLYKKMHDVIINKFNCEKSFHSVVLLIVAVAFKIVL